MFGQTVSKRLSAILVCVSSLIGATGTGRAQSTTSADKLVSKQELDELIARLESSQPDDRVAAADVLCKQGDAARPALPKLIDLLGDQAMAKLVNMTSPIRSHVVKMLGEMRPAPTDALLAALGHQNRLCRLGAAEALGISGDIRAIRPLIKLFADKDQELAGKVSTALVAIGRPAIDPVIDELSSENPQVRSFAVYTLGRIRDRNVVHPIGRLLFDPVENVRGCAAGALQNLAQTNPYGEVWRESDQTADEQLRAKARKENDAALRDRVIREIDAALRSDNAAARLTAAKACYSIWAAELCESLAACLSDTDKDLRREAVRALSVINDSAVFPLLLVGLKDQNADVRAEAANGIRYRASTGREDTPFESLVDPLRRALGEDDKRVRISAAEGLITIKSHVKPFDAPNAARLLDDEDPKVVEAGINLLTVLKGKGSADLIAAKLKIPAVRTRAATSLAALGDRRALEPLRDLLAQKDKAAIAALGNWKDRESVSALIEVLEDKDESVRRAAAESLGAICDTRAVEPLCRLLKGNEEDKRAAAGALARIKDPLSIGPMIEAANGPEMFFGNREPPYGEANPVAEPLSEMGDEAIDPLVKALKHESGYVRSVAAYVLDRLASPGNLTEDDLRPAIEPLAAALADPCSQNDAALALAELHDGRGIDVLIAMVQAPDAPTDFRSNDWRQRQQKEAALFALARLNDPKSAEPLVALLDSPNAEIRHYALMALGNLRDKRTAPALADMLQDAEPSVRAEAASSLCRMKLPGAIDLVAPLLRDGDSQVRAAVADALGSMGNRDAVTVLLPLLDDPEKSVRTDAAEALARLKDPRGREALFRFLQDPDRKVRRQAISSLHAFSDEALFEPLAAALNDPDAEVRRSAAALLGDLGTKPAADALLEKIDDPQIKPAILTALVKMHDDRVPPVLIQGLNDQSPYVRRTAAWGIAKRDEEQGVAALIQHINDPARDVRVEIIHSLALLNTKQSIDAIRNASSDEDPLIRSQALRALNKVGRQ